MDHSYGTYPIRVLTAVLIDRLSISWRKTIRKSLNVPARTASVYLPLIM